ncbi:MAG: SOS response-associated peptidase [Thermoguttaceae bacterium]
MCGRFTLRTSAREIAEQFALGAAEPFSPRFNIAPSQPVAVVRIGRRRDDTGDPRNTGKSPPRELAWLRWGLVPSWARDPNVANRLINVRAETAATKPAFRAAMRHRRCLILADGFYEWQPIGRAKQPYFIHLRDNRPLAFAGLWESWEGPVGQVRNPQSAPRLETCALLTTEANDLLRPIHDRMPVVLPPDGYSIWLDPKIEDAGQLAPLLVPYPAGEMEAYPVSRLVNDPAHESPDCIAPGQPTLF